MRFRPVRSPSCPLLELPLSEEKPPPASEFYAKTYDPSVNCKIEAFSTSVNDASLTAEKAVAASKIDLVPGTLLDQFALKESGKPITPVVSKQGDTEPSVDPNASANDVSGVANLGRGVLLQYCPGSIEGTILASRAQKELTRLTIKESARPSASQLAAALLAPAEIPESRLVSLGADTVDSSWVLVPEVMQDLDCCRWNGDGHYDMSPYPGQHPPSLGQVMTFLKLVDAAVDKSGQVLCLSSPAKLAHCAVLAGAVLVLARGCSAEVAWQELLRTCPAKFADPHQAWDRFPPPFSLKARTSSSSLRVVDCLAGLEFARDRGWIGDYQTFNVPQWQMLRRRLDASWVIPGKVLAMANPYGSSNNPKFPGLLESGSAPPERACLDESVKHTTSHDESKLQAARGLHIPPIQTVSPKKAPPLAHRPDSTPNLLSVPEPSTTTSTLPGIESFALDPPVSPVSPSPSKSTANVPPTANSDPALFSRAKIYMEGAEGEASVPTFSFRITSRGHTEEKLEEVRPAGKVPLSPTAVQDNDTFMSYLQRTNVVSVIRLNRDAECPKQFEHEGMFTKLGIKTHMSGFDDGGTPTMSVLRACLTIFNNLDKTAPNSIAVHCMGGLGRTACIVGAYAVSCFKMQGPAFHGWCRICRPGTVQTPKQEAFIRALRPKAEQMARSISTPSMLSSRGRNIATSVQHFAESLTGSKMWI